MQRLRTDRGGVRGESGRSLVGLLRRQGVLSLGVGRHLFGSDLVVVVKVLARVLSMVVKEVSVGEGEMVLVAAVVKGVVSTVSISVSCSLSRVAWH